jgi:tetratricopeptide (TPR) repeat protein
MVLVVQYNNQGLANKAKGDNDRAIADYTDAIKLDPEYGSAYIDRAVAWQAKGDNDRVPSERIDHARMS